MASLGRIAAATAAAAVFLAAAGAASASVSLVSVPLSEPGDLERLEATGLDVTHDVSPTDASVALYNARDRATLSAAGFEWRTVIADLQARNAAERASDASAAVPTALPSGRSTYRVYDDYVNEINALAEANPEFVRKVVIGQSYEGRDIVGLEIAADVNRTDDGRPVYLQMGLHHAREWPSGEFPMEFAIDLVRGYNDGDPRIVGLLQDVRTFVFPVINVDGFIVSRGAALSGSGNAGTYPSIVTGSVEYKRKNCRPADEAEAALPCAQRPRTSGIDLNRNYGYYWGGPGSSNSLSSDSYRGTGPFSEPESQAVHQFVSTVHPTVFITNHTFTEDGKWLRQPGFDADFLPQKFLPTYAASGCSKGIGGMGAYSPDEDAMMDLGDEMATVTGWKSELGYETLCDITGATEDWNYFGQGTYGYTPEARGTDFHPLYQSGVVAEYGDPAVPGVGVREAFLVAAERAADEGDHGLVQGSAPPGATLTLQKDFEAPTFDQPALNVDEQLETTLTVPADGTYQWHVNPSDRPQIGGGPEPNPGDEVWKMICTRPDGQAVTAPKNVEVARGGTAEVDWTGSACEPPPAPNQPPVADFEFAPSTPVAGEEVTFTSLSTDSDGAIDTTEWDFDGGAFDADAAGPVATHAFATAETHQVSLRVTDDDDATDTETKTVTVAAQPPPNEPPEAAFSITPANPKPGDDVTFTSSSSDGDGSIQTHEWDLDGDRQFDDALGGEVTRIYTEEGRFEVSLRVTDDRDSTDTATKTLVVGDPSPFCRGRSATIVGSPQRDSLLGTPQADVVVALSGDDTVTALGGADLVCGRRGKDALRGGRGRDVLVGGRGRDRLLGGGAADLIFGNKGVDLLLGGGGADRCLGGRGRDAERGC